MAQVPVRRAAAGKLDILSCADSCALFVSLCEEMISYTHVKRRAAHVHAHYFLCTHHARSRERAVACGLSGLKLRTRSASPEHALSRSVLCLQHAQAALALEPS